MLSFKSLKNKISFKTNALTQNQLLVFGLINFVILFSFGGYFYLERTLYADPALQMFFMISQNKMIFFVDRYSMFFNEILPFIAFKLNFPLKTILFTYSVSFTIVSALLFYCAVKYLKNFTAGIMIMFVILLLGDAYVHTISETWQGLVYSTIFYAWINYSFKSKGKIPSYVFLLVGATFFILLNYYIHAITLFSCLFVVGYTIINKKDWKNYALYGIFIIILIIYLQKFFIASDSTHEGKFFAELKNFKDILPNYKTLYSKWFFFKFFKNSFFIVILFWLAAAIMHIVKKEYLKFTFVSLSIIGFYFIIVITFHKGDSNLAMFSRFLPLIFLSGIPFINDVLLKIKNKYAIISILSIIMFFGYYSVNNYMYNYKKRLTLLKEVTNYAEEINEKKCYISGNKLNRFAMASFGFSCETLLYSSLEGKENSRTIYINPDKEFPIEDAKPDLFLAFFYWKEWSVNEINNAYFELPEGKYVEITKEFPE